MQSTLSSTTSERSPSLQFSRKQKLVAIDPYQVLEEANKAIKLKQSERLPKLYQFVLDNNRFDFFYTNKEVKAVIINAQNLSDYQKALKAIRSTDNLLVKLAKVKLDAIADDPFSLDSIESLRDLSETIKTIETQVQMDEIKSVPEFTNDRINRAIKLLNKSQQKKIKQFL